MAKPNHSVILALVVAAHTQTLNPSARDVIKQTRSLVQAEVAAILDAARHSVAGRAFRLALRPDGPAPVFLMGPDGRPRYLRMTSGASGRSEIVTFIHYTGTPAHGCDGLPRVGELVLQYGSKGGAWTVEARTRSAVEVNDSAFDMLAGRTEVRSGPFQRLDNKTVRGFTSPYRLPEGAMGGPPPGTTMSLWLDVDSLLPVRWSLKVPGDLPEFGIVFVYFDAADFEMPPRVRAPICVP